MEADTVETKHALPFRRCEAADLFKVSGEDCAAKNDLLTATNAYLSSFVAPTKNDQGKPACFHCGEELNGFTQVFGLGVAYEWTLAHGEARCSGCGWPARGMHYPKDDDGSELWTARNLFLAYHPDMVGLSK